MPAAATDPADYVAAIKQFHDAFGVGGPPPVVVQAPGRVNLIGEHTDYNDGFVFPMAIEPHVLVVCRKRDDGRVRLSSTLFPGERAEFTLDDTIAGGEPKWANYSKGIAAMLLRDGRTLAGMDALLLNTLPMGGGLSSSAAIEIGTGRALLALVGQQMDAQHLALLAQTAEHEYARAKVGIMDQTIVAAGRAGTAMLLDCRNLENKRFVPLDPDALRVVVVNSMVKHDLAAGGGYAERRAQCEQGVAYFQKQNPAVTALRDVTMDQVNQAKGELPEVVFRRCRPVVTENARTAEAADLPAARDYKTVGQRMVASHNSLRDDYEVSTPELDYLVEQAMTVRGVYGARMTGGGFGGCIVALVEPAAAGPLVDHVKAVYPGKFGVHPDPFVTTATDGARVVA